jgi:hypothetical protein
MTLSGLWVTSADLMQHRCIRSRWAGGGIYRRSERFWIVNVIGKVWIVLRSTGCDPGNLKLVLGIAQSSPARRGGNVGNSLEEERRIA